MNRKNKIVILTFALIVLLVFLSGLFLRRNSAGQSTSTELQEKMQRVNEKSEWMLEAEQDRKNAEKDVELVKEDGNIFEQGEYKVYGGFGYRVTNFKIYDSYEDLKNISDCCSDNEVIPPEFFSPFSEFVCLELEITNVSNMDVCFFHPIDLYVWQDEKLEVKRGKESWGFVSGEAYIVGVERLAKEKESNIQSRFIPLLLDGETITLKYYFEVYATRTDESEDASIKDIYTHPEYTLRISGIVTDGEVYDDIKKDKTHIYFRCGNKGGK